LCPLRDDTEGRYPSSILNTDSDGKGGKMTGTASQNHGQTSGNPVRPESGLSQRGGRSKRGGASGTGKIAGIRFCNKGGRGKKRVWR